MGKVTARAKVLRLDQRDAGVQQRTTIDTLAVEEPLEVRLGGEAVVVTMRTPGHDVELAHGWLHAEGYITGRDDVRTARFCEGDVAERDPDEPTASYNIINVALTAERARLAALDPDLGRRHNFLATSSCGICGTQTIEQLMRQGRFDVGSDPAPVTASRLWAAVVELQRRQPVFEKTGSIHGAALFDQHGRLLVAREDVGRHNAVDKVIGWAVLQGLLDDRRPLAGHLLVVSSRASFEIVQKAHLAGIPVLATVSGATSLAVQAAEQAGITLAAFVREPRATVYSRTDRVQAGVERSTSGASTSGAPASGATSAEQER